MAHDRKRTPDHNDHLGFPRRAGEAYKPNHSHADIDRHIERIADPATTEVTAETGWGLAAKVGSLFRWARADHGHGTPANPVTLATSVVTETAYGQAAAVGTSGALAKADHTHGTPPVILPTGPICEISQGVNQSIPKNVDTQVTLNQFQGGNVDLRSGLADLVIQTAGYYLVYASFKWAAQYGSGDWGGYRSAHVTKNNVIIMDDHDFAPVSEGPASTMTHNMSRAVYLAVGDTLRASVLHSHPLAPATDLNLLSEAMSPLLGVVFQAT